MPPLTGLFSRLSILLYLFACATSALAMNEKKPIHYSGDKQLWDRKTDKVELFGHASMHQPGEVLTADYILLDQKKRTLDARGNCTYVTGNTVLNGEEMHFNLDSRTGSVSRGRVSGENFTLGGERINKLGPGHFQTHWGEYSTCRDCPQSWTFMAEDVDLEVGGYAYMDNVTVKMKDTPTFWFPYLIVPIKTSRQTGFLFPKFGFSNDFGFMLVEPFFWAVSRNADMTVGLGRYSERGLRGEWEGRYLGDNGSATGNFYYLHDGVGPIGSPSDSAKAAQNPADLRNRWGVDLRQEDYLPFGIYEKLRLVEMSDNLYPRYIGDIGTNRDRVAASVFSLSRPSPNLSALVALKRYRNLVNPAFTPTGQDDLAQAQTQFDPHTVQVLPTALVTTNDQVIPGTPLYAGVGFGVTNFTRSAGPFDNDPSDHINGDESKPLINPSADYVPGVDPIREATRASVSPSIYTSFRPFDVFQVTPSARYYGYFYDFHQAERDLYRGYLLTQIDLSTQFERVYDMPDPDIPRWKHIIRPSITYSNIPISREDKTHPFMAQINRREGYNFDNEDIVPITIDPTKNLRNYFYPLGNSLSYGLTTQLIRRRSPAVYDYPTYETFAELRAGQAFNFKEYQGPTDTSAGPRPFSRFYSSFALNLDKISTQTDYYYYPYIDGLRHELSTNVNWVFQRSTRFHVYTFDRSFQLNYTWNEVGCKPNPDDPRNPICPNSAVNSVTGTVNFSINDYLLPSFIAEYDLNQKAFLRYTASLAYQSPAQCWKFTIQAVFNRDQGTQYLPDLALNISGQGFGGLTEVYDKGNASSR